MNTTTACIRSEAATGHSADHAVARTTAWPLERALFLMAGVFTLASASLAALVSPWFLLLTGFVGVNQLLYVAVHNCGASLMLKRFAGLKSAIYPNG